MAATRNESNATAADPQKPADGGSTPTPEQLELDKKAEEARLAAVASNKAREAAAALTGLQYCVLPGISISTFARGIVEEGQPVTAADFHNGQAAMDDLIRRGCLVQRDLGK
jgi:hypothetical protein